MGDPPPCRDREIGSFRPEMDYLKWKISRWQNIYSNSNSDTTVGVVAASTTGNCLFITGNICKVVLRIWFSKLKSGECAISMGFVDPRCKAVLAFRILRHDAHPFQFLGHDGGCSRGAGVDPVRCCLPTSTPAILPQLESSPGLPLACPSSQSPPSYSRSGWHPLPRESSSVIGACSAFPRWASSPHPS